MIKKISLGYLRLKQTLKLMIGLPDYETYVTHRETAHPNEEIMSYEAFFRERQKARYAGGNGKMNRCC